MGENTIILCVVASQLFDGTEASSRNASFLYENKYWQIKDFLADNSEKIVQCIQKSKKQRTRKICFKQLKPEDNGDAETSTIALVYQDTLHKARSVEIQIAAEIFPLVFTNYTTSLEFKVYEQQNQRLLKSYVTTQLYDELYRSHLTTSNISDNDVSLPMPTCFKSKLRKYQERSVRWMLSREREDHIIAADYTELVSVDNRRVYKHNYCIKFCAFTEQLQTICLPPGGILADEMGLGKTVELLAMVMLNARTDISNQYWHELFEELENKRAECKRPRTEEYVMCICLKNHNAKVQCNRCYLWQHVPCVQRNSGNTLHMDETYICPSCWTELTATQLVEAGTTFIVSPNTIKMQWLTEISTHISPTLKVLLYPGIHSGCWYSPMELSKYDVVLADYETLRSEIYHTNDFKSDRVLRHPSRFMRPISPLLMVDWWRVCLDEAQMVESNTSHIAEIIRKLPAVNRWAVTGTPIQHSIHDLPPLLRFVGYTESFEPMDAWQTVVNCFLMKHNSTALIDILKRIMWRTCKSKVEEELGIPPQMETVHRLELSNVELLYYREEHLKCTTQFLAAVEKHIGDQQKNSCLATISPQLLSIILKPFLRIRQQCSVPVILSNNTATVEYLSPESLLVHLTSTNEMECKSKLRSWASAYNGIASIHFIKNNYLQAIQNYKLVLKLAKDYNDNHISVDSVLQIHALYNMLEANFLAPEGDKLPVEELANHQSQLKKLEWKYLEENTSVLNSSRAVYETKLQELETLEKMFDSNIIDLFATVATELEYLHDVLWNKICDELSRHNIPANRLENVRSITGFVYILNSWYGNLSKLKKSLKAEFEYLNCTMIDACEAIKNGETLPSNITIFFKSVSDCHLSEILDNTPADANKDTKKILCRLCQINELLYKLERLLFSREEGAESVTTEGIEKPSLEICILKATFSFLRTKCDLPMECKNKLEILDCVLSLCKSQVKYWIEVDYVVKTFDELNMCKMRISLTDDLEERSNHRVVPAELDEILYTQSANAQESQLNFTRLAGRLKYLKHLSYNGPNMECPICHTDEDDRYVMLVCGHFTCPTCLKMIKSVNGNRRITTCPTCRQDSPQLYYSLRNGAGGPLVKNVSRKIEYIVQQVLNLTARNDESSDIIKILIFSQWSSILKHVAQALDKSGVKYRNSNCTKRDIEEFKDPEKKVTCLLMPLSRGSKGLNLIEATHVFLVEPILNPGDELQAIGRVHRFGQTKPTMVHRFIVNDTIEENILALITSADDKQTLATHWDLENMTLDSLTKLFKLKDNGTNEFTDS